MRDILYKGKRRDKNKWHYGSYLFLKNAPSYDWTGKEVGKREDVHFIIDESDLNYAVDPETVCQFTGLQDKKGKKIFEGDIVKTSQYGVDDGNGHNYAGFDTFSVEFLDGGFCLKNKWRRFNLRPLGNFEIIGNIFDNPELIKE